MRFLIGTSGFSYPAWKGSFYPSDMKADGMLRFYSDAFGAVEINNTFYRMPKEALLEGWREQVHDDFRFVLKAPQRITHHQKLVDVGDSVARFFAVRASLGEKAGPSLFQLPPFLKKDRALLEGFFALVPDGQRIVMEFGNPSWYDDEIFEVLEKKGAALCIIDDEKKNAPFRRTAPFGYFRLRRVAYSTEALTSWRDRIREAGFEEAFVFFKHEDEGTGPKLARALMDLVDVPS